MSSRATIPTRRAMAGTSLLEHASPAIWEAIDRISRDVRLDAGQTLFAQGDPGDALYVVEDGAIEISVLSPGGRKLSLNVMGPGDVFGEIALLDAGGRSASAMALLPSRLRQARRADLMAAMRASPDIATDFIDLLCERLRWVNGLLEDQAFLPLPVRLAKRLLDLEEKMGDRSGAVQISQAELADFLGATREAVARVLAAWRRRGWVELSRGVVRVADRTALDGVAGALDE